MTPFKSEPINAAPRPSRFFVGLPKSLVLVKAASVRETIAAVEAATPKLIHLK